MKNFNISKASLTALASYQTHLIVTKQCLMRCRARFEFLDYPNQNSFSSKHCTATIFAFQHSFKTHYCTGKCKLCVSWNWESMPAKIWRPIIPEYFIMKCLRRSEFLIILYVVKQKESCLDFSSWILSWLTVRSATAFFVCHTRK